MNATGLDLADLVRKLAALDYDQQLEALVLDWAGDCRGLCDDAAQLYTASELACVKRVSKALSDLCGVRSDDALAATRSVLLRHPRRESAVSLINEYHRESEEAQRRTEQKLVAFQKLQHERNKARSLG